MGTDLTTDIGFVTFIGVPSIFAGQSATTNIEAQDKDRVLNVGHHIGRINIDVTVRKTTANGVVEFCVFKVERQFQTPVLGNFPIPSSAEMNGQGMQQICRLNNPGKVFHFSQRAYATQQTVAHKIIVSPAKYKLSKMKAGDHWVLMIFNRSESTATIDVQMRYKEYE